MSFQSWTNFDVTFAANRHVMYSEKLAERISTHRRALPGGMLFVDRLLAALGVVKAAKLYPPRTNAGLRDLFRLIVESKALSHHKQSVIYYILRDLSVTPTNHVASANGASSLAPSSSSSSAPSAAVAARELKSEDETCMRLARACYIPEKYRSFVEGLWWMDNLEFRTALQYLTDPSLPPTFPDEILHALCTTPSAADAHLAYAYHAAVHPPLLSETVLFAYFDILLTSSPSPSSTSRSSSSSSLSAVTMATNNNNIHAAFNFACTQPLNRRKPLLNRIITYALSPAWSSTTPVDDRSVRAATLIALPFSPAEEAVFEECLLRGEASEVPGAKDTVLMRKIAMARWGEIDQDDELKAVGGRRVEGVNWDDLRRHLNAVV